jgi:hypothetical protein
VDAAILINWNGDLLLNAATTIASASLLDPFESISEWWLWLKGGCFLGSDQVKINVSYAYPNCFQHDVLI